MRYRTWLRSCGMAAALGAACLPAGATGPLDEASGILRVCAAGPSAALARAERIRGAAGVMAADVLPNPSLVAAHQQQLSGPTDAETVVGLSIPLGIGGRRAILQDAARARQEQALLDARTTLFESALAFREAYVAAIADEARVEVAAEQQVAMDALTTMIQGLSRGGEAAGYDLLRQQTQARLHRRPLESLRARAARSRTLLEVWTGDTVTLPRVPLTRLAGGAAPAAAAAETHPRVESLEASSRASGLDARAAHRRWVPDLEVFAGYRAVSVASETGHGVSLGLTVPLTFFDHGQGDAARSEAEVGLARAAADLLRRRHRIELRSSLAQLALLEASQADADQVVADAAQVQSRAERLYAAGEASITELLDAFHSAEEARLGRIALGEEIAMARLTAMRATGSLFDPGLDRACGARPVGAP